MYLNKKEIKNIYNAYILYKYSSNMKLFEYTVIIIIRYLSKFSLVTLILTVFYIILNIKQLKIMFGFRVT